MHDCILKSCGDQIPKKETGSNHPCRKVTTLFKILHASHIKNGTKKKEKRKKARKKQRKKYINKERKKEKERKYKERNKERKKEIKRGRKGEIKKN